MNALYWVLLGIIFLSIWFTLDYNFGKKYYVKRRKNHSFNKRWSDIYLYTDGIHLYKDLFTDIEKSHQSIHILFYIVRNDSVGQKFLSLLSQKAQEGVEVKLLLDYIGSFKLKFSMIKRLKENGVDVAFSRKPRLPFLFYTFQSRNHRKIAVIDSKVGYVGGFNIGKEYIGQNRKLGFWRDYHIKCKGEGVYDLQTQFLDDWLEATKVDLRQSRSYFPPLHKGSCLQQFIPTYGNHLEYYFISLIRMAKKELFICSPYFIPSRKLQQELLAALKQGVHITVIVPIKSDHLFVKEASYSYFGPLLKLGCNIYQYDGGFYHAKVIVVDDKCCDIGTANFDNRSLFLNEEMNCFVFDQAFIQLVKDVIKHDLKKAKKLTYEQYEKYKNSHRIEIAAATLLFPFL
ncbi:cardiolipin synthase [Aeribacillus alveayuensis]|uniref:Cardiolipin synthase n=1 Tax=Aeribacillus alveayuensis TaxID=279215 RepID=A0ABT9VP81_9BACI|nr:cardiolipin synthase [Bacillus alveayuensis]